MCRPNKTPTIPRWMTCQWERGDFCLCLGNTANVFLRSVDKSDNWTKALFAVSPIKFFGRLLLVRPSETLAGYSLHSRPEVFRRYLRTKNQSPQFYLIGLLIETSVIWKWVTVLGSPTILTRCTWFWFFTSGSTAAHLKGGSNLA